MRADGLDLAPFRGLRYVPERVSGLAAVTSPPYDVVVRPDGLRERETADPHNIVRLILPRAADPAEGHRRAGETLRHWREEGVLAEDDVPALYAYEQRASGTVVQRGLMGALLLTPPDERVVLPHEDVMPEVVAERTALMRATAANLEPLLLTYQGDGTATGAAAVLERCATGRPLLATVTGDGIEHRVWSVTARDAQEEIRRDLARRRALIADGHHRWATCLRLRAEHGGRPPWDRGLVLLVDSARHPLQVHAIHRVLPWLPAAEALGRASGAFRVRPAGTTLDEALATLNGLAAADGNAFVLAGGGAFHLLYRPEPALLARTLPAGRPPAWRRLDAAVLHAAVLGALWDGGGMRRHASSPLFVHDARAAVVHAERAGGTAVLMRPVPEATVRELAERGVTMPHKSTSFGPKPASGLVLRDLGEPRRGPAR